MHGASASPTPASEVFVLGILASILELCPRRTASARMLWIHTVSPLWNRAQH